MINSEQGLQHDHNCNTIIPGHRLNLFGMNFIMNLVVLFGSDVSPILLLKKWHNCDSIAVI